MSIRADEVLDLLDAHINNDPGTGLAPLIFQLWTHFFPADTQLTVFRSEQHWAVFIEIVCFRPGQGDSSLETWCYSNCQSEPGQLWYDTPYEYCPAQSTNGDGSYPETPFQFCIAQDGQSQTFSVSPEEYAKIGVIIGPDIKKHGNHVGGHILRFLCDQLTHPFHMSEAGLRELLEENWREGETPRVAEMAMLWQTPQWRHPTASHEDVERPRNLPYFQALSRAIATGDVTELRQQDPATFNTDWRIWDAEERAEAAQSRARREAREQMIRQQPPERQEQLRAMGRTVFLDTLTEETDAP